MKTIAVQIEVEHVPTEDLDQREAFEEANALGEGKCLASAINESFTLCVHQDIDDSEPTGPHAEKLINELGRRYRNLNARKTN